jgi:DNA-binding MarR family transcriptional regulator
MLSDWTIDVEQCQCLRDGLLTMLGESDRRVLGELAGKIDDLLHRLENVASAEISCSCDPLGAVSDPPSAFSFGPGQPPPASSAQSGNLRAPQLPLPDPRLLRRVISQRQLRAQVFPADLFSDPAWDILLDLTAAHAEHKRVSVTSLCIASGVPSTTALRWIRILTEAGLLVRLEDTADRRRAFIALSDRGARLMARYFALAGPEIVCPL